MSGASRWLIARMAGNVALDTAVGSIPLAGLVFVLVGGAWNFDRDNRKTPPRDLEPPPRPRFAPDAIHRQGRNTIARNNLCNMIKDERLSLAWGEADPFLGLRQSTSFGIRHRVATFNNFHTRQTRSREPLSLFACSGWFARHKQKGQG